MFAEELAKDRQRLDVWLDKTFSTRDTGELSSIDSYTELDAELFDPFAVEYGTEGNDPWQDTTKPFQVLTFLCSELQLLERFAKKRFYPVLYVVGKSTFKGSSPPMGDSELQLATLLPTLQDVLDFLGQLDNLLTNLFRQISAVVLDENLEIKRRMVATGLRCASRGLVVLLTIQTLVSLKILPLFFNYRRMLHTMMAKSDMHGAELGLLEEVQEQVVRLEESLRLGAFSTFIDSKVKNSRLRESFKKKRVYSVIEEYVKETIESLCSNLSFEEEIFKARSDILATLVLFVTYCWIGSFSKDKKLVKTILEIHEKASILPLYGNLVVNPSRFIVDMMPASFLSYLPWDYTKRSTAQSNVCIQNLLKSLEPRLESVAFRGAVWSTELLALVPQGKASIGAADQELFFSLILEGLNMMLYLHSLFDQVLQLHVEQLQPMSKHTLRLTTDCIWYMKLMAKSISNLSGPLHQNFDYFSEHYKLLLLEHFKKTYDLLQQLDKNAGTMRVRKVLFRLGTSPSNSTEDLQVCILLVKLGIEVLQDAATVPQRLLINFILHAVSGFQFIPEWVESQGIACLKQMEIVEHLPELLENMGNLQFLYFHPEFMRNAIEQIFLHPDEAYKLQYLLDAFLDVRHLAQETGVISDFSKFFDDEVYSLLKVYLTEPLGHAVERDLLKLVCKDVNLPKLQANINSDYDHNVLPLMHLQTLNLISKKVDLGESVLIQLIKNLRRRSRRGELEWTSLCKIKNIAIEKYGIDLESIDPSEGTMPSSLDHLTTAEGLKIFIASYMFQLHSLTFVASPRTTSGTKDDIPSIVEIEEFMDLIQADIIQMGSEVLECIFEKGIVEPSYKKAFRKSSKSISHMRSDDDERQEVATRGTAGGDIGEIHTLTPTLESMDKELKNTLNSPFDNQVDTGKSQWSFIQSDMHVDDHEGSENSVVAIPSTNSSSKESRVSALMSMLKDFLSKKLSEVCDLCSASETRSVFSQATQRWLNSQNAVGNQYPAAQAEIVRKEITALMKAGTLSTNPIHRLRHDQAISLHIKAVVNIGKLVALFMLMFHGAISVRERALGMLPRELIRSHNKLQDFLKSVNAPDKVLNESLLYDCNLDGLGCRNPMNKKFAEMLAEIFEKSIEKDKAEHMQGLFVFLPAMSLNHVESMLSLKNQYQGINQNQPFAITEDSFALGASYLLSMLNQIEKFDGLNWFDSAYRHYSIRFNRLKVTMDTQQSIQATLSRQSGADAETQRNLQEMDILQGTMKEIKLLENSMLCSTLFFQFRDNLNPSPRQ